MKSYATADFLGHTGLRGSPWQFGLSLFPVVPRVQDNSTGTVDMTNSYTFNGIGGDGWFANQGGSLESGFLVASRSSGLNAFISVDNGATWDLMGSDPSGVDPDQPQNIVCSVNEALVLFGNFNYTYGLTSQAVVGGSSPGYVKNGVNVLLDTPPAGSQLVAAKAGNVWFVAGWAPGTDDTAVSRTTNAFGGAAPTFTRVTVDASTVTYPTSLCAGPVNAALGAGVVLTNWSQKIYFATAASPASWTTVTAPAALAIGRAVYNAWHGKWLVLQTPTLIDGLVQGYSFAPRDMTTTANWRQVKLAPGPTGYVSSFSFDQNSAPAAVGEWCFFTTLRGGLGSSIIGTPDMGDTWYRLSVAALSKDGSGTARSYPMSICAHQGRLFVVVSGPESSDYVKLYVTPLLELPPATYVRAP